MMDYYDFERYVFFKVNTNCEKDVKIYFKYIPSSIKKIWKNIWDNMTKEEKEKQMLEIEEFEKKYK